MVKKHLFNELLNKVLLERKNSFTTLATYDWEKKISKKALMYFEDQYIEDVGCDELYAFFNTVRFKDNGELLSDKYLKAIRMLLKALYKKAVFLGYVRLNPFDYDFKMPKGNIPEATDRIISDTDIKKLLSVIPTNDRFNFIIPILLLTGLRIGELLGLYWSDVDFQNNILYIKRATTRKYIEKDGEIIKLGDTIGKTKTQCSVRELPVSQLVMDLLIEWKQYINSIPNLTEKIIYNKTENLVFVNYRGNIINYNTLYKDLQEFLMKNGLQHCGILFHKLRHCYATNMVDCGVDINIISKLLGHRNITTTANTYIKVNLEPKKKAVKLHENYMSDLLKAN